MDGTKKLPWRQWGTCPWIKRDICIIDLGVDVPARGVLVVVVRRRLPAEQLLR